MADTSTKTLSDDTPEQTANHYDQFFSRAWKAAYSATSFDYRQLQVKAKTSPEKNDQVFSTWSTFKR